MRFLYALLLLPLTANAEYTMPENGILRIEQPGQIVTVAIDAQPMRRDVVRSWNAKVDGRPQAWRNNQGWGLFPVVGALTVKYLYRVRPINGVLTCEKWLFIPERKLDELDASVEYVLNAPCS